MSWVQVLRRALRREPSDEADRESGSPSSSCRERFVLTVGHPRAAEGLDIALQALARLRELPRFRCWWSARPDGATSTSWLRRTPSGLTERQVRVLGTDRRPGLAVVLRRATALLMPSRAEDSGCRHRGHGLRHGRHLLRRNPGACRGGRGRRAGHTGRRRRPAGRGDPRLSWVTPSSGRAGAGRSAASAALRLECRWPSGLAALSLPSPDRSVAPWRVGFGGPFVASL